MRVGNGVGVTFAAAVSHHLCTPMLGVHSMTMLLGNQTNSLLISLHPHQGNRISKAT
jgi:hypothetical protein